MSDDPSIVTEPSSTAATTPTATTAAAETGEYNVITETPAATSSSSSTTTPATDGPIRTIFVSGWPADIKQREVHNLFRFQPGFEHALLNNRGKVPVAFITFKEHENAVLAMSAFQSLRFEHDNPATDLRVELAKQTSFIPGQNMPPGLVGKKRAVDEDDGYGDKKSRRGPPLPPGNPVYAGTSMRPDGKHGTLYIVNIGPNVTEEELRETFSQCPGFRALKLKPIRGGTAVVAWCDYATPEQAQAAMDQLQGHRLPVGLGSALKIDFANSAMNVNALREGGAATHARGAANAFADPYAAQQLQQTNPYGGYYYPPVAPPGYPPMFPPMHPYPQPPY